MQSTAKKHQKPMKDSNTPLDVVLMKMELKLSLPSPAPPNGWIGELNLGTAVRVPSPIIPPEFLLPDERKAQTTRDYLFLHL